jgi:hypothetical protein
LELLHVHHSLDIERRLYMGGYFYYGRVVQLSR